MRAHVVRIGNSCGIRIPKPLLAQVGLADRAEVELDVQDGALVIRRVGVPREGWEEAFARMAAAGDDTLLDAGRWGRTAFDEEEWEWR